MNSIGADSSGTGVKSGSIQIKIFVMHFLGSEQVIKAAAIAVIGLPLLYLVGFLVEISVRKQYNRHTALLLKRTLLILGACILAIDMFRELGLRMSALLGSAGIAGMAIGFALKTSIANIISGLLISLESPFGVDDYIETGGQKGTVLSFDLLSVKLLSPENNFIRIPNEQLLQSSVINHTKNPIKRIDIPISFGYRHGHFEVYRIIEEVVAQNSLCLKDPSSQISFSEFSDSAIHCIVKVWVKSENYFEAKRQLASEIHRAFAEQDVSVPFPQLSISSSEQDQPLKIEIVNPKATV